MNRSDYILESERTLELLREIEANSNLTQRYLAQKYDISLGKTNFIIKALLDKGLIKVQSFKNSKNKMGYIYLITPHGISTKVQLIHKFFIKKVGEYERLKREIEGFKGEFLLNK
ncbi:MAG: MarR family EPS-associated transcriptional regulator [Candidatus Omnitrophica bacterium]|nr:MarR family EPS-associated transcriptional regulator [Candidatus Omnitrophota bacterium]